MIDWPKALSSHRAHPPGCQLYCQLAGEKAKLGRVWPPRLRHSCGYYLANKGTDLRTMQNLGHRDPKHTAHHTRVAGLAHVREQGEVIYLQNASEITPAADNPIVTKGYRMFLTAVIAISCKVFETFDVMSIIIFQF